MSDEDLSKYIPLHGDRVRLKTYLKGQKNKDKATTRKDSLLSVLRAKVEARQGKREKEQTQTGTVSTQNATVSDNTSMRGTKRQFGNRNAKKGSRRILLGWIHKNASGSVQVRQKKGGGARRVEVKKDARKQDLIEEGKKLFFPNGESSKGKIDNFKIDLWDFQDKSLPNDKSVGEIYEETKIPLLRFYFATVDNCPGEQETCNIESSDNDSLPDLDVRSDTDPSASGQSSQDMYLTANASSVAHDVHPQRTGELQAASTSVSAAVFDTGLLSTAYDLPVISVPGRHVAAVNTEPHTSTTTSDNANLATTLPGIEEWQPTRAFESNSNLEFPPDFTSDSSRPDLLSEALEIAGILNEFTDTGISSGTELIDKEKTSTETKQHVVRLHRGHVLREMIEAFKDIDPYSDIVSLELYMPNGEREAAEDSGGVTRDVVCEFWGSFYELCTLGSSLKVPCLRHDFGEKEWGSVAKIMIFGWRSVQYFPVHLSLVFLEQCLYGHVISKIIEDFWLYLPDGDAQTLKSASSSIDSVDSEELLDIMQQHEVKSVIRADNVNKIINEIAHKELIQSAMFVIDCWHPLLKNIGISKERLSSLYTELFPKPRRVAQILKFPDAMSADELAVSNHLRRFVRELDENLLKRFLRFCTGSDLLLGKDIEVSFVNVTGLARRPVAHTCSCLLELPKTYENFPQFRSEFLSILNANVWVMDII